MYQALVHLEAQPDYLKLNQPVPRQVNPDRLCQPVQRKRGQEKIISRLTRIVMIIARKKI